VHPQPSLGSVDNLTDPFLLGCTTFTLIPEFFSPRCNPAVNSSQLRIFDDGPSSSDNLCALASARAAVSNCLLEEAVDFILELIGALWLGNGEFLALWVIGEPAYTRLLECFVDV
jgi:hypothetical protein